MAEDGKAKNAKKKKVLSLLDEDQAPKKSRREKQREKQAAEDAAKPTVKQQKKVCLLYTSPSPRDQRGSRMPSSA